MSSEKPDFFFFLVENTEVLEVEELPQDDRGAFQNTILMSPSPMLFPVLYASHRIN